MSPLPQVAAEATQISVLLRPQHGLRWQPRLQSISMALGGNASHEHQHSPLLWEGHGPRHGPLWQHSPNSMQPQVVVQATHNLFLTTVSSPALPLSTACEPLSLFFFHLSSIYLFIIVALAQWLHQNVFETRSHPEPGAH